MVTKLRVAYMGYRIGEQTSWFRIVLDTKSLKLGNVVAHNGEGMVLFDSKIIQLCEEFNPHEELLIYFQLTEEEYIQALKDVDSFSKNLLQQTKENKNASREKTC